MNNRGTMFEPEEDSRYIQFTPEQLQALADMYRDGWSTRKLAKRYGINPCTVQRRLVALGVTLRPSGFSDYHKVATDEVIAVAHRLRDAGAGWRVIHWATGVKPDTIMGVMRRQRARQATQ